MKTIVYVCYIQNYLGLIDSEDVVENMCVESDQGKIDAWFLEQIQNAKEDGFVPEEDPNDFIGMNDYELTVTKGNEKAGYTSYGIVCRPFEIGVEADE